MRQSQHIDGAQDCIHDVRRGVHGRAPTRVRPVEAPPRAADCRDGDGEVPHSAVRKRRQGVVVSAIVFDCDGVLADTERDGHRAAFNQMFREVGVPLEWSEEEYGRRLMIAGGKERMASELTPEFVERNGLPADPDGQAAMLATWHRRKTEIYTGMVANGALPTRPGVTRIIREAQDAGWKLAVASTSAEPSV